MPIAVIRLAFDPLLHVGDGDVRLETVALAAIILVALLVAGRFAAATPAWVDPGPYASGPRLRLDDLLFIAIGIIPGAVIGGRLAYALLHADYYAANPFAITDPSQGGLSLSLAVAGGALTGGYVTRLVSASVGRWAHAAILPTLFLLAAGKLAGVLGADGQGAPSNLPWATSYAGDGPWSSLAAFVPSHPSQVYEALAVCAAAVVLMLLHAAGVFRRRDGTMFPAGIALWAIARAGVATTWRDSRVLGPLRAEQLIDIGLAAVCLAIAVLVPRLHARRVAGPVRGAAADEPEWPDPANRPRF